MKPFKMLLSWCLCLMFLSARAAIKLPPNQTIPAVIVFGDSIVDTGNNNYLKTLLKCNFPPHGEDFPGAISTGRCCDGKVVSDIIVEELGIKSILPAYLDPNLQPKDLRTGVAFASAGSGYDPLTSTILSVLSLADQISYFKEYIGKLQDMVGEDKTNYILANSLFLVDASGNDIGLTYFLTGARKIQYDIPQYASFLVKSASDFLTELYYLGARRIGVFSAIPLGCVPLARTIAGGAKRECAQHYNQLAQLFNTNLSPELDSLNRKLPQSKMVYIDFYDPLLDLFLSPEKYGFSIADKGCCGTGNIEFSYLCNELVHTCPNVSTHVFWDSIHPTEKAYRIIIGPLIHKYINKFF